MPTFVETLNPTPFGFFDSDAQFQAEADGMVTFVKRKLGDDVLSVELTKKEIWTCFEEACCEYSRLIHEMKIQSELINVLGLPTGSTDLTNIYPRQSLEFLIRQAEPYATEAFLGGPYDAQLGYIDLVSGQQDYNIYDDIKSYESGSVGQNLWLSIPSGSRGRMKIVEVFHVEPLAAQHFLLNASNITNFLATNFNYESYVNSTIFYVLPVFEDVLRRGMLETAFRVRRSNYSYEVIGSRLRIYPAPVTDLQQGKLFIKVFAQTPNPVNPNGIGTSLSGSNDSTLYGISGPSNVPLNNLPFTSITQPGRQWIRQYTLALAKELLGLIRSKFQTVPIPNADLQLNGERLLTDGREDQNRLRDQMKDWLAKLTNQALMEQQSTLAEQLQKQLKYVPMPLGKSIIIG
jgi:hypothetical protein